MDPDNNASPQLPSIIGRGLSSAGPKHSSKLDLIVANTLVLAKSELATEQLHQVGDYELYHSDYLFLCALADLLDETPDKVMRYLDVELDSYYNSIHYNNLKQNHTPLVKDGHFRLMLLGWPDVSNLDLSELRHLTDLIILSKDDYGGRWSDGDRPFTYATFENRDISSIPPLTKLSCYAPQITKLDCSYLRPTELDLSSTPLLTTLNCRWNGLIELDLSPTPLLTTLDCGFNELSELDLSPTPLLTTLFCSHNKISELDLSPTPLLEKLDCEHAQLTELDLSSTPLLTILNCGLNGLIELDLSPTPLLTILHCQKNPLSELDFTNQSKLRFLKIGSDLHSIVFNKDSDRLHMEILVIDEYEELYQALKANLPDKVTISKL